MIKILDCTLRDGGYINDWEFGEKTITDVLRNLDRSGIDIIEIGFLNDTKSSYSKDITIFKEMSEVNSAITDASISSDKDCVAMIMHGKFDVNKLPDKSESLLKGIRYCFKKSCIASALVNCEVIAKKGYDVYIQPASLTDYSDWDILNLVDKFNQVKIKSFYMVDTYGLMRQEEVIRYFYIIDNNLKADVPIGFHSHNNLQLSFSNSQALIGVCRKRDLYIDSSVFGMGRGAGNLCTELLMRYVNETVNDKYDIIPILEIMDENIMPIYACKPWGYSAPYYIAAINNCHPNYATYLINKQTICIRDINAIIKMIPTDKRRNYDEKLITDLYTGHLQRSIDDSDTISAIKKACSGRKVLIIAPGQSIISKKEFICDYIEKNAPVVFCVNHVTQLFKTDFLFISNAKRFKSFSKLNDKINADIICTSNITPDAKVHMANYAEYLNENDAISDNSGLMIINLLIKAGVNSFALAGYDGFSGGERNYYDEKLPDSIQSYELALINTATTNYFDKVKRIAEINFITPSLYNGRDN